MSQSLYPVTREPHPPYRESAMTKVLAVLLLVVAGALVFTVVQQRSDTQQRRQLRARADRAAARRQARRRRAGDDRRVREVLALGRPRHEPRDAAQSMTLDVTEIPQGTGSGFVWDQQGHIVTNFHVVQGGDRASVTLNDGTTYPATIVGNAPDKDIAVLQHRCAAAEAAAAAGRPVGEPQGRHEGARDRQPVRPRSDADDRRDLGPRPRDQERDAAADHRRDPDRRVDQSRQLGRAAARQLGPPDRHQHRDLLSPSGANAGIGFAVPVDTVNAIVPQLLKHGKIVRPGLGINIAVRSARRRSTTSTASSIHAGRRRAARPTQAGIAGRRRRCRRAVALGDVIVGDRQRRDSQAERSVQGARFPQGGRRRRRHASRTSSGKRRTVKVTLQASPVSRRARALSASCFAIASR